jgi:hypothetical protein
MCMWWCWCWCAGGCLMGEITGRDGHTEKYVRTQQQQQPSPLVLP